MSDITLSNAVRSNLLSLQNTADLMSTTQNRLSTGNKVNSALDNPSNWFTAQGLNNRAGDLNALMDQMASGVKTLEAADAGLSAITKTLESMQSTLRQARQDKSFETDSYSLDEADFDGKTELSTMSFSGGAFKDATPEVELNKARAVLTAADNFAGFSMDGDADPGEFTAVAAKEFTIGVNGEDPVTVSFNATSETNLQVTIGSKTYDTEIGNAEAITKEDMANALNAAFAGEDIGVTVDASAATLKFTVDESHAASGEDQGIVIAGDNAADLGIDGATDAEAMITVAKSVDELVREINSREDLKGSIRASNDRDKLRIENQSTQELAIDGVAGNGTVDGTTTEAATIAGNEVRADLADQFRELRDQLDKLADDASFNGVNLLRGDNLTITFNETGTSSIDIQTEDGETINAANLGVPTSLQAPELDSDDNIDKLLGDVKGALDGVRSQASTFGSNLSIVENRQNFTRAMIDTLESGAGDLTLADMNEEAANLLALQTRQQLSSNSLSLASQADQSVLQLLR